MTREELDEFVDENVTNKTAPLSLTPAQEGAAIKKVADYVDQTGGYIIYSALISQSGTSAPTIKELKNTTGVTFTPSFSSTGIFLLTGSSNVFTADKTATPFSFNSNGSFPNGTMSFYSLGAQFFQIETRNSGTLTNGVITDAFIEIRVYN